jgi:hypothetical protein
METIVATLANAEELERYIRQTLCQRDRLDPKQTSFYRTPILRHGQPSGFMFHVRGPRMLRNAAIWAEAENRILFYDAAGTRFLETKLTESPSIETLKLAA